MVAGSAPAGSRYVGVRAKDLGDWASYGSGLLGLQRIDKSRSTLAFRMDDRKQRIIVDADGGEGYRVFRLGSRGCRGARRSCRASRKGGIKVAHAARALADERHVKDLIVLNDPQGNRLEIFHGAETTSEPFKPGRSISGFRTGPLGLGHVVLNVDTADTIERMTSFYRDTLGFRLTDYYSHPFIARFLHLNPRHHSLAFVQSGKNAVHHVMMELFSFDDVGQGYDLALNEEPRRGHAWAPYQRFHHLVLFADAVVIHGRVWLGRAFDRCRYLAGLRAQGRAEHVGPRPRLAAGRGSGQGARVAARQRRPTAFAGRCR